MTPYLEMLMISIQSRSAQPTAHRHLWAIARASAIACRRWRPTVDPILLLLSRPPPFRRSTPCILLLLLVLCMTQLLLLSERTVSGEPLLRGFVSIAFFLFAAFRFFAALFLLG